VKYQQLVVYKRSVRSKSENDSKMWREICVANLERRQKVSNVSCKSYSRDAWLKVELDYHQTSVSLALLEVNAFKR